MKRDVLAASLAALLSLSGVANVWADLYVVQGPFVTPVPGPGIPPPGRVPGKEYSSHLDREGHPAHALAPLQVIDWDGNGGTANGLNYSGTFGQPDPGSEVDALAYNQDALFHSVVRNTSALLVSVEGDSNHTVPVWAETISGPVPLIWATPQQLDENYNTNYDLDGLDVWGPEQQGTSNRFSLEGDPGQVAVWAFDSNTLLSAPFVTSLQIATAIGRPDLAATIDLDALMVWNNELLFSIRPLDVFDGGEIWYWDGVNSAQFLYHGGHLWDTAFNVTAYYGAENVDALEAVSTPEPSTFALVLIGAVGAAGWRRRVVARRV